MVIALFLYLNNLILPFGSRNRLAEIEQRAHPLIVRRFGIHP